ncbi:hypothetical protein QOZ88_05860 [Blastococcus sp. BMG 814]|uniref:Uncharacterized protein n=1 Tax=Blastococcus carthaginiensis TaxID=3050034 RepID=A0ABT9IAL6_9ACTN|nr:hypothetical protein [Blastococcus carthaginiensis]MDP5182155.1 hypothetical protein [Blastococcus carthaginiensis]
MSSWLLLAVLVVALAIAAAPIAGDAWGKRRAARARPLPHRPAPGAPRPAGARHRIDDAHTASYSAAAVLQALRDEADARHAAARKDTKRGGRR